ncbi:Neurotransmitter-gated ion-channel ligand binding domain protein [Ancylostoma ceylanicum]|uniref:Neurotransmitter-gated ion-channel ligand binding domain protein n=1 Tax=Ancylostoma ceylanicum TaxID=53326 RepID=A0A0D6LKR4_9BILA|nr:Neurotransmitter-gated ion-channel ligand binding domain protein [Ancylostoma ceylanicum]
MLRCNGPSRFKSSKISKASAIGQQQQLMNALFTNYKKELRPVKTFDSGPTNVTVQLYFKQIQKVQENDQIITIYCWLEEDNALRILQAKSQSRVNLYWFDEFLTWNPDEFGGVTSLHVPSDMIWRPDLLVYNNANMNIRENEMQTNALIQHTGHISLFRALITDVTCDLRLEMFPYDQQICFIMLASWSYDGSQIMLHTAEEPTAEPNTNRLNFT